MQCQQWMRGGEGKEGSRQGGRLGERRQSSTQALISTYMYTHTYMCM